ncbi:MAG: NifU family protein, partial [Flavobacteriales bacterium]
MESKRLPFSIYAEMTPNPSVMKFVCNQLLNPFDSMEFKSIEEAQISPLCSKLFTLPFVKEVFLARNFVSITKYNILEWDAVNQEVRILIQEYLSEGGLVLNADYNPDSEPAEQIEELEHQFSAGKVPENEIEERIVQILDEYVKPSVAMDGGDIVFDAFENGILKVKLQGACNGCPSASMTLKQGIENLFKQMMPDQVLSVE